VGLLADPGLPDELARRLADELPALLGEAVDDRVEWTIRTAREPFEVASRAERVIDRARARVEGTSWDVAVCLTDLPLPTDSGVVVADVSRADRVALLSIPALGGIRLRRRCREVVVALVAELVAGLPGLARPRHPELVDRLPHRTRRTPTDDTDIDIDVELVMQPARGRSRLLAGMVRANRPWQLALGLSTALAGAATGSAFGIIYSNVWQLGTALAPWRLATATMIAVTVFTGWLISGHGLWLRDPRSRPLGRLLNLGTVLTVVTGVLAFYTVLVTMNAVAAVVIIPPDYFAGTIGRAVGWTDYLRVALMASVLGLVAGAVGSGLEDDDTVRRAAYSTREQQRRAQLDR